jgi:Spy/CpxP family protein refolding chaperone
MKIELKRLITLIVCSLVLLAQSLQVSLGAQQTGELKTLSTDEIRALLNGEGMGAAKAAELNHYPGPRHVLDFASQLQLSEGQRSKTQGIYGRMHEEAVGLGKTILHREEELDHIFKKDEVDSNKLKILVMEIGRLRGELRLVHLLAHLEMKRILSREQIEKYDELQGYKTRTPVDQHHHRESH